MSHLAIVKETPDRVREMPSTDNPVIDHLQQQIANSMVLFVNYKHYRWLAVGPLSGALQALFDEFAGETLALLDRFSERVCVVGRNPVLVLGEVARTATVDATTIQGNLRKAIEEAHRNSQRQVGELREAVRAANTGGDPGTAELFATAIRTQEKHEWSFRRMLKSPGEVLEMPPLF
jgi:starvation-inducible DNA-binding protein